ncbi:hypothetical protein Tco_0739499, partial [Tanacetum coccineum]
VYRDRRFLKRHALTHNPTIYDSLVKQFWQTAIASTLTDGTLELRATIDTLEYTITEASVRSKLQLADASGISMLPKRNVKTGVRRRLDAEDVSTGFEDVSTSFEDVSTGFTNIKSTSEKVSSGAEEGAENARREELKRQDELAAKRVQEELELFEAQKKRMAQVQEVAQFYTEEDWDTIWAKLEANADLVKEIAGEDVSEADNAQRMVGLISQRRKLIAKQKVKAQRDKPMTQAQQRHMKVLSYTGNTEKESKGKEHGKNLNYDKASCGTDEMFCNYMEDKSGMRPSPEELSHWRASIPYRAT